jgi:hypothetical protein
MVAFMEAFRIQNIEKPLIIHPDAFCLPPETGCEILIVLNKINEEYKAEFNKNNCKAKDTLAGFAQAFTVITSQALSQIGEFFDFEKDATINDRVINPSQDPLILNLKKLKIDPFVCEKIAYYQEKIATIRNDFLSIIFHNTNRNSSDLWRYFSEKNLIEQLNTQCLSDVFRAAAEVGDIQIFRGIIEIIDGDKFNPISPDDLHFALRRSSLNNHLQILFTLINSRHFQKIVININELKPILKNASDQGHSEIVQALINSNSFKDFNADDLGMALFYASESGYLQIVQAFINSGRFQDISAFDLVEILECASKNRHLEIVQAIKATDRFKQLLKDFPEKFNKFL